MIEFVFLMTRYPWVFGFWDVLPLHAGCHGGGMGLSRMIGMDGYGRMG